MSPDHHMLEGTLRLEDLDRFFGLDFDNILTLVDCLRRGENTLCWCCDDSYPKVTCYFCFISQCCLD